MFRLYRVCLTAAMTTSSADMTPKLDHNQVESAPQGASVLICVTLVATPRTGLTPRVPALTAR